MAKLKVTCEIAFSTCTASSGYYNHQRGHGYHLRRADNCADIASAYGFSDRRNTRAAALARAAELGLDVVLVY